jgi:SAM-dependent methyltransferase
MDIERLDPKKVKFYQKKLILEHLERYTFASQFVKGKIVAELGCGSGYGSQLLAKAGAKKVNAIDIDKDTIAYARKNFPHKNIVYKIAHAENTKQPAHQFDIVISFETIEHLEHPEKLIKEARRLLKNHGLFILSTPNRQTSFEDNPFHLKEFTLQELDGLLSEFKIKRFYGQRKVLYSYIALCKKLYSFFPASLRLLFHFRPWEHVAIRDVPAAETTPYLYLLAVCQK